MHENIAGLSKDITELDAKIDGSSSAVAESLENTNEAPDTLLKDHEIRIVKHEQKSA